MKRKSIRRQYWLGLAGACLGCAALFAGGLADLKERRASAQQPPRAVVQFGRLQRATTDDEVLDGVFLPADREVTRQLERARELLEDGRYGDAAMLLDQILEGGEDFFFKPDDNKPVYRSLKAEAQRLIGSMPGSGREAYQLQFEIRAKQMLEAAAATGDVAQLEEIARRYFHTPSGYEATLLLGRYYLDHNQPLAAAFCFQRLSETAEGARFEPGLSVQLASAWVRSGMEARAAETLAALKKRMPRAMVRIGDKQVRLLDKNREPIEWLTSALGKLPRPAYSEMGQWAMHRGSASRNAASGGGSPLLSARWRVPTTNHPAIEKALIDMRQWYVDQGSAVVPCVHPLAINDLVLMRSSRDLLAVDFETGKRLWEVRAAGDTSLEQAVSVSASGTASQFEPQSNPLLANRFWEDSTFGTLSSDGERVFMVAEAEGGAAVPSSAGNPRAARFLPRGRRGVLMEGPQQFNKLVALELASEGKLVWEAGGETAEENSPMSMAYFLGPPLPLQGKVYALAEVKGEIRLFVLDARTGDLEWSQQLAAVEQDILRDPFRRYAGCTPSFSDGVLVCPTMSGAVVAVDLSNRSLLWGYQYQRNQHYSQNNAWIRVGAGRMFMGFNGEWTQSSQVSRWLDGTATIAEGRVILTPLESDELHCLNLVDGKPAWNKPISRGDDLYVGCVHEGNIVLVGLRQVRALKLANGQQAWKKPIDLPVGASPSGRGFLSGDDYYLPLTTAEVVRIDLKQGKITARSKSRKNNIPGNLICYKGEVISQGVDFLETFFQLEPLQENIAQRLSENPNDAWALAHRGELALDEGRLDDALDDIRASYKIDPAPFTRDLLVEALLGALSHDFVNHPEAISELESLVDTDEERVAMFRVLATGLRKSGDVLASLRAFLELSSIASISEELDEIDAERSASRNCWTRAEFKALLAEAGKKNRAAIDAAIEQRLERSLAAGSARSLERFLSVFADHPLADRARDALVDRLGGDDALLRREQVLRQLERSSDPAMRKSAMVRLAGLLRDADHPEEALAYYRRLKEEFGDQRLIEGQSVEEYLDGLPSDSRIAQVAAAAKLSWPKGSVSVEKSNRRAQDVPQFTRLYPVDWQGARNEFFQGVDIGWHHQNEIVGRDGLGGLRFRISLNDGARQRNIPAVIHASTASAIDHVLIVSLGNQVYAVDTLRSSAAAGTRILWTYELSEHSSALSPYGNVQNVAARAVNLPWGGVKHIVHSTGQNLGSLGPCTSSGVCLQRAREIVMLDPISGSPQWIRRGMTPSSELFGDEELIFVAAPGGSGSEATVLRAADGEILGKRKLPPADQRWTTLGRYVLGWQNLPDGRMTLALYDPWNETEVWSETFQHGSKAALVDGEAAAIMQRDGKFVQLNLADGKKVIDEQLEPERNLQNIYVLRSSHQDILVTDRPPDRSGAAEPNARTAHPAMDAAYSPMVTGRVYAFDRSTGKPQWAIPATVEEHGLPLAQAPESPVLTFVRTWRITRQGRPLLHGSILCIDKRDGRLIYEEDDLPQQIAYFDVFADLEAKTVTLQASSQAFRLRFTDSPVPPEPPYQAGVFQQPEGLLERGRAGALFRALGRGARALSAPVEGQAAPFEDDD